jgi:small subunit ribosomal protein S2
MSITEINQKLVDRLFSAGAHFGFQKSRRHPTMKPYLYGTKLGTDIFDLEKSVALLEAAKEVMKTAGANGKTVLMVGSKEEIAKLVKDRAIKAGLPYVTNRWIGGILTNFTEIKKRLQRLATLTAEGESGELERKYTKKERVIIGREAAKLVHNFGGITTLERNPDFMLVVDPRHDHIATTEARDSGLPIIGIMSSDNDATLVTYPVVVNDSLQASVSLILDELVAAYQEGASTFVPKTPAKSDARAPRTSYNDRRPSSR